MGKSFSDYADIILADDTSKVASQNNAVKGEGSSLLEQLAAEINGEKTAADVTSPAAPSNEGTVTPAASSVTGITPEVQSSTEAVIYPQAGIAGCDPAEVAAGEVPQKVKPSEVEVISAGDGKATTPNLMHKTPTAMAEGADSSVGAATGEKTASTGGKTAVAVDATPEEIGVKIANSMHTEIARINKQEELSESIEILKTAGLTAEAIARHKYNFDEFGIEQEKTAGQEVDYLQKVADGAPLGVEDIVGAAHQVIEFEKEAAQADEEGRAAAHEYSQTEEFQSQFEQPEETKTAGQDIVGKTDEVVEKEKIASLLKDPEAVKAIQYLKQVDAISLLS